MYHKPNRKEATQWPVNPQGTVTSLRASSRAFPKGERLTVADVAHYTGWSRRVVSRIFPFKELDGIKFITRTTLARLLS